jgi:hypothetical protein
MQAENSWWYYCPVKLPFLPQNTLNDSTNLNWAEKYFIVKLAYFFFLIFLNAKKFTLHTFSNVTSDKKEEVIWCHIKKQSSYLEYNPLAETELKRVFELVNSAHAHILRVLAKLEGARESKLINYFFWQRAPSALCRDSPRAPTCACFRSECVMYAYNICVFIPLHKESGFACVCATSTHSLITKCNQSIAHNKAVSPTGVSGTHIHT